MSGRHGPRPARTPEGRRQLAKRLRADGEGSEGDWIPQHPALPLRVLEVGRRVLVGVWQDGFIHAGNLAYMAILSLFPFFIIVSAVFSALGQGGERDASVGAFLGALPPVVARTLAPVARDVMAARHGWLLWAGGLVGLWTVTSLIETIRDILHRAYGIGVGKMYLRYRLFSGLMTMGAVVLLLLSLYAQVGLATAEQLIAARFAHFHPGDQLGGLAQAIPALVLFASIYLLFLALTPGRYRRGRCPLWPGALLVTGWWVVVSLALPVLLHVVFKYDLTYGSLAGVMIALFFFWLVGLGVVTGAELNAALAQSPEERDLLGQADNRAAEARAGPTRNIREASE